MSAEETDSVNAARRARAKGDLQGALYVLSLGGAIIYCIALFITQRAAVKESDWLKVLFSLPALAQLVGFYFHVTKSHKESKAGEQPVDGDRYFYVFSMTMSCICIAAYCVLWVLYSIGYNNYLRYSYISLVIICALICVIGVVMCAFLHDTDKKDWPKLTKLRDGSRREPLWALSFLFFVIFLDVAFLFGFAFAFHDQYYLSLNNTPALRMSSVDAPDEMEAKALANGTAQTRRENDATAAAAASPTPVSENDDTFHFYFTKGKALLLHKKDSLNDKAADMNLCGEPARDEMKRLKPPQRRDWIVNSDLETFNYCSMMRLKERIAEETSDGRRIRIVLDGRSDEQKIDGGAYRSNYELSAARVENVRFDTIEALKSDSHTEAWHNLEWLTLSSSNENSDKADPILQKMLDENGDLNTSQKINLKDRNKRVVIASVVSINDEITSLQHKQLKANQYTPLKLMDYMYFALYTITTTGYGDIIPTTAYCKFVISIANICEVLFLVVFFNALVSVRSKADG